MTASGSRRVVQFITVIIFIPSICAMYFHKYEIPDVTITALYPKGFKASIPYDPKIYRFWFQGNVHRPIRSKYSYVGTITGQGFLAEDGRWTVKDPNIELNIGDVIIYDVSVQRFYFLLSTMVYYKKNLSYTVTELKGRPIADTPISTECKPTVTRVRAGTACAGQTIFEENFDNFRDNVWQIEQYLPVFSPNFPFVSYQRLASDPTVSVSNGKLRISPKLQQRQPGFNDESIYSGAINLISGCTSSAEACTKQAWGADILPPIISGKITTKGFAFTYGIVTVRAKLPQGDWLYPEILLEPFLQKYGSLHYSSGVIQIASARGNRQLSSRTTDYSNKVLFGGPIMDFQCHDTLLNNRTLQNGLWGDDYHEYSVRWEPDRITLSVDGAEWARVEPTASGLRSRFPKQCSQLPRTLLQMGSKMAPFDDHFYITLGLGVGSITEFPDGVRTVNDRPKPWRNPSRKALLKFWQDMTSWLDTWHEPQMLVDYVKVVAL